jgi:DNA-binding XRE family transcriptional regulator
MCQGLSIAPSTLDRHGVRPEIRAAKHCREIKIQKPCPKIETALLCPDMETSDLTPSPGPYRIYTPETLGAAIRHYRTEAGLSQVQLAQMTGLNRTYLSNLESGKETEQVRRMLRVLRQLGVRMTLDKADW